MKFALYHPWIYLRGGVERLLLETLRRSRHDWTIWTHHYEPESTFEGFADLDVRRLQPEVSVQRSFAPLLTASARILRTRIPDEGFAGLLVSSEGLGDFLLAQNRLPAAAYCHTPLKILHDPVTRLALASRSRKHAAALQVLGPPFNAVDRRMWRRYRHVFVNSTETLHRCGRAGLHPDGDLEVLHPGVDLHTFHDDSRAREPFFLVAGRIMWQKNIDLALAAARELDRRGTRVKLVIAGAVDQKSRPYLAELRAHAAGLDVEFVVNPTDARLASLYRRCTALLYTPWNEDFGIVPLEAMASGAPVLAVDSGGPRETVIHGETGWLLPDDPLRFADAVADVLDSPERLAPMRRAARRRAEWFTWERVGNRIDDVMEHLAVGGRTAVPPGASGAVRTLPAPPPDDPADDARAAGASD